MNLQIDEEFQSLIPPLTPDEFSQLEANLISDGCRDPLVLWDGIIVDGHNRYRICTEHHIPFKTVDKQFDSRDDVILWIIDNQRGRRNLSDGARAMLELRAEPILKAKAKERMLATQNNKSAAAMQNSAQQETGATRDTIAKRAGVSHDTVDKVKKIVTEGTDEQKRRIWEGASVRSVYREIHPANPKPEPKPESSVPESVPLPPVQTLKESIRAMKEPAGSVEIPPNVVLDEFSVTVSTIVKRLDDFTTREYACGYPSFTWSDMEQLHNLFSTLRRSVDDTETIINSYHSATNKGEDV